MCKINKRANRKTERRQSDRRGEIADHQIVRGEVHCRGDGAEGDGLRQRTIDRERGQLRPSGPPARKEKRDLDSGPPAAGFAVDGSSNGIPDRFMYKIKPWPSDQSKRRKTGSGGEFADDQMVRGEVQGSDDDP